MPLSPTHGELYLVDSFVFSYCQELVEPDFSCIEKVFEADAISWCEIMVRWFMRIRCAVGVDSMGYEGNIAVLL